MKKNVFYLFIFWSICISAQRISNFITFQVNQVVSLNFTLLKGSSCNGFSVLYSSDSINFNIIYEDPTICGNSIDDEPKSWIHSNPLINQINYYKIQLNPGETSPVNRIFVNQINKTNMIIFPNPISNTNDLINIKIIDTKSLQFIGFIYDQFGKCIQSIGPQSTLNNTILKINEFSNGLYLIKLNDGYNLYSTKFIIQK